MFESEEKELDDLIKTVQAFKIPTPVVIDGQPQRIEFTRQNKNDMSTIYNTYNRIRGEMGVTARYPELFQQIQLLTPKIQTIMMHFLSNIDQGIGEFDDAASSNFTVEDKTLEAFKQAFGLPEGDNWKAFFDMLDKVTMLDDIKADRSKQFVDERSRPIFNGLWSIADIWSSVVRENLKGRITQPDQRLAQEMRSMLLHQMAYYWDKRDPSLRNLKLEWVEQLQNGTGEDDQALIKTIKEQCPSLVPGDESKEVVLANIKQAITDLFSIITGVMIESYTTAYGKINHPSCIHGILNRLKLNLKIEGREPEYIGELLLQNMGVMSTYDHSMPPFFSLFADKVVVYDPEQAEFNPGAYANGIFEGVFGDKVIDASWVNDTSVDEKYRDMPDEIRSYIKSFHGKLREKISVLQNPQEIKIQDLQELGIEISDDDVEKISTPGFLIGELKSQFVKGLSQKINNLFNESKPVTEEERKSVLKLIKTHPNFSDEELNSQDDVQTLLNKKISELQESPTMLKKFLALNFQISSFDPDSTIEAIMKIIDSKAKFNRGEVDIKLEDAHQILKVDKEKLKGFCSLCFTEKKEVYIEKFKQELLVKGFPIALIKILDLDLTYEPIKDMTYGQVESGYETRLESLKEQLFSSAQQRLNYTYTSSGMTTITDEEVLSYQMLRQSGMLTDEMIAKIISRMHRTLMNNNKVWMALQLELENDVGLSKDYVRILKGEYISTADLGVDIKGHSIIWWAVNYNDQEMVDKIKRLLEDSNNLKVINEALKYNLIQEIPEKLKLDFAIKYGQVEDAKKLIRSWDMAKLVQKNNFGQTPMHLAIKYGRADVAEALIGKLSKKKLNEENFLLHMVLKNVGMHEVARQLIEKLGKDKLVQENQLGQTPLHLAIMHGNVDVAKELINKSDKDKLVQENQLGQTPLHLAIQHKQHDVLKELMNSINPIRLDNLQFHIRFREIIDYLQSDVSELESNQKEFDDAIKEHQNQLFCQINLDMGKNDSRETHLKNIERCIASLPSRSRQQINSTLDEISKLKQLETKLMSYSLWNRSRHKDNINKLDKIEILLGNVKKLYDLQTKNGLIIFSEKLGLDSYKGEGNTRALKARVKDFKARVSEISDNVKHYESYRGLGPTRRR